MWAHPWQCKKRSWDYWMCILGRADRHVGGATQTRTILGWGIRTAEWSGSESDWDSAKRGLGLPLQYSGFTLGSIWWALNKTAMLFGLGILVVAMIRTRQSIKAFCCPRLSGGTLCMHIFFSKENFQHLFSPVAKPKVSL